MITTSREDIMGAFGKRPGMTCGRSRWMDRAGRMNAPLPEVAVRIVDDFYRIRFQWFHKDMLEKVRQVEGRRWDKDAREWLAPVTETATRQLIGFGFLKEGPIPERACPAPRKAGAARRGMSCSPDDFDFFDSPDRFGPEPLPAQGVKPARRGMAYDPRGAAPPARPFGPDPVLAPKGRRAVLEDGYYSIYFPYDKDTVEEMKKMGARFESDEPVKFWKVKATGLAARRLVELGFLPESELGSEDYGFMDGLGLSPRETGDVKRLCGMELSAIVAGHEGLLGIKLAICAVWAKRSVSLPCVIATTRARKRAVMDEIRRLLPDARLVSLTEEAAGLRPDATLMDRLMFDGDKDPASKKVFEREKRFEGLCEGDILVCDHREAMFWGRSARKAKTVVIDEAHQLGALKDGSWAPQMFRAAYSASNRMFVTSQSIADRPMRFFYPLNMLAPRKFGRMLAFGMKFCDPEPSDFAPCGFAFRGSSNTEELLELAEDIMISRAADEAPGQLLEDSETAAKEA